MRIEPEDLEVLNSLIDFGNRHSYSKLSKGVLLTTVARHFLGSPYRSKTLDVNDTEELVINLRTFDCQTFVETCLAFVLMWTSGKVGLSSFTEALRSLRYRNGKIEGYPSRLHYLTDWIHENERNGILRNLTEEMGGVKDERKISFMTNHQNLYRPLENPDNLTAMKQIEDILSQKQRHIIPKEKLELVVGKLQEGDIVGIATNIDGLDCLHMGIITIRDKAHMIHASSREGCVIESRDSIVDYLYAGDERTGIVVCRLH
ncbi:MAG: DUF1460 domain-containing protein [Syntrophales bacterium]|nr:DUF1460 domain-containing protein [Syntrophales bacterium]